MPLSDAERDLLKRAVRRDPAAFSDLYVSYQRAVYMEIYGLLGDTFETDDLTSETFLRAWNAIHRFEDRGFSIETWLERIAHNLAISHLRRRGRESTNVELELHVDPRLQPDEQAEIAFENEIVRQALLDLPSMQRKVLTLRFFHDLSYPQVAELIGKPQGTVRVIQYRALRSLRCLLEKGGAIRRGGKPVALPATGGSK
jgi:RNA polymerase sigma-70 factor (ECF subfamily)